jgi:hypothetical protein
MKSLSNETKPPFLIHILVNLVLTFALSLSMYLLLSNILLTIHKISIQTLFDTTYKPMDDEARFLNLKNQYQNDRKYYDCADSVLTLEECELLNNYHNEYMRMVKSNQNDYHSYKQISSLKVNTSLYIH